MPPRCSRYRRRRRANPYSVVSVSRMPSAVTSGLATRWKMASVAAGSAEFEEAKPSTLAFEAISRRFAQRCWFWRGCVSGCSVVYGEEMVRWTVDVKRRFVDGVASLSLREELTPPSFRTEPTPLSLREELTPLSFRMASTSS